MVITILVTKPNWLKIIEGSPSEPQEQTAPAQDSVDWLYGMDKETKMPYRARRTKPNQKEPGTLIDPPPDAAPTSPMTARFRAGSVIELGHMTVEEYLTEHTKTPITHPAKPKKAEPIEAVWAGKAVLRPSR